MKQRATFTVFALIIVIALFWYFRPSGPHREEPLLPTSGSPSSPVMSAGSTSARQAPVPPEPRSTLADDLNAPAGDIHRDLRVLADVLAAFRSNFPHDGNPVGNNAEITAALTGKNKLHLALIPPNHPAIRNGELCDRWGTPFFFHAESGTKMGLRSAGPDQKLWTDDDIALVPQE